MAAGPLARILFVDDSPTVPKIMSLSPGAKGLEVVTASTGAEGVVSAGSAKPDLIVLDIHCRTPTG